MKSVLKLLTLGIVFLIFGCQHNGIDEAPEIIEPTSKYVTADQIPEIVEYIKSGFNGGSKMPFLPT